MATTYTAAARPNAERRFYTGMALAMTALMLIGFAPSFFLRGVVDTPRPLAPMTATIVVHAVLCTLWLAILCVQTLLVAADRRDLHIRLGVAGMGVALLAIPFMYLTMVQQVARGTQPPGVAPLGWTALPMGTLLAFATLVLLGYAKRRDRDAHKRLMLAASLVFMGPAVGRISIGPPTMASFLAIQALGLAPFLVLLRWDRASLGRCHWASGLGFALTAGGVAFGVVAMTSPVWIAVAAHLPGV